MQQHLGMRFTTRHRLNTDAETYWGRIFFDDEYQRRTFMDALHCLSHEKLAQTGDVGGPITRKQQSSQQLDAPGPVRKLIGQEIGYIEEGTFDPDAGTWTFTLTTSKLPDKIKVKGVFRLEPADDGVDLVSDMETSVRIFGIGPIFEKFIEKSTRDAYDNTAAFTNEFIKEKGF